MFRFFMPGLLTFMMLHFSMIAAAFSVSCSVIGSERVLRGGEKPKPVITADGTVFRVSLSKRDGKLAQRALAEDVLSTLHLRIKGIELPENAELIRGVRIFINNPKADAKTSIKDPTYAGSFALGFERRQNVIKNIAPSLRKLLRAKQKVNLQAPLSITLVLAPTSSAPAESKLEIPLESVTLSMPRRDNQPEAGR